MNRYLFVGLLVLAGCSTMSDVVPMGNDTYTVAYKKRGGLSGWGEVKQTAIKEANAFCAGKGQQAVIDNTETHGVRSLTPQEVELTFRCTPK